MRFWLRILKFVVLGLSIGPLASVGADPGPDSLMVVSTYPPDGAQDVDVRQWVQVQFDRDIGSCQDVDLRKSILIRDDSGRYVEITSFSYGSGRASFRLRVQPDYEDDTYWFKYGTTYVIQITRDLKSDDCSQLERDYYWSFNVKGRTPALKEHVERADAYLLGRVSEEFFERYVTFLPEKSDFFPPNNDCPETANECGSWMMRPYSVVRYLFAIPNLDITKGIGLQIGEEETPPIFLSQSHGTWNVPNCLDDPQECEFSVDESQAVALAIKAGLPSSLYPLEAEFQWSTKYDSYVWSVFSHQKKREEGGSAYSDVYVIDANSGEVLSRSGRFIT